MALAYRIIFIILLLGFIHVGAVIGEMHFGWIFSPYDGQDGPNAYSAANAVAVAIMGVLIFLASWLILLLADMSRLRGMCSRLVGPLIGNQKRPARSDMVFVGLLAAVAVMLAYIFS